ncbi:hypothetical protein CsSME_00024452 [Camellia sinensis var. sinensis]
MASPSGTSAHVIVTPQTLSDETQPPDDTNICGRDTGARRTEKYVNSCTWSYSRKRSAKKDCEKKKGRNYMYMSITC